METKRIYINLRKFQNSFTGGNQLKDRFQELYSLNSGSFTDTDEAKNRNRYLHKKLGPMYAIAYMIHYHPKKRSK